MALCERNLLCTRCCQLAREANSYFLHFPAYPAFSTQHLHLRIQLHLTPLRASCPYCHTRRPFMGPIPHQEPSQRDSIGTLTPDRPPLVGRRQQILWNWHRSVPLLGCMEVGSRFQSWPPSGLRHWLGRGSCGRTRPAPRTQFRFARQCRPTWPLLSSLRQHRDCISDQQREVAKS